MADTNAAPRGPGATLVAPPVQARPPAPARAGVTIDALSLTLPGRDAAMGRRVATAVAERLARALPFGATPDLAHLRLSVQLAPGSSEEAMADAIANAITRSLTRGKGR